MQEGLENDYCGGDEWWRREERVEYQGIDGNQSEVQ